jgi:hypothetical protein
LHIKQFVRGILILHAFTDVFHESLAHSFRISLPRKRDRPLIRRAPLLAKRTLAPRYWKTKLNNLARFFAADALNPTFATGGNIRLFSKVCGPARRINKGTLFQKGV